jgi:hypothetical protein
MAGVLAGPMTANGDLPSSQRVGREGQLLSDTAVRNNMATWGGIARADLEC